MIKIQKMLFDGAMENDTTKILSALEQGIDVNCRNEYNETALHMATVFDRYDAIRLLLSMGADPNVRAEGGYAPLHYAVKSRKSLETIALLVGAGADMRLKNVFYDTPFSLASKEIKNMLALFEHLSKKCLEMS